MIGSCVCSGEDFAGIVAVLLSFDRDVDIRATGSSMGSTIVEGETVRVAPVRAPVRMFDIVFYENGQGQAAIHRVIAVKGKGAQRFYLLRGDACGSAQEWVNGSKILGRVKAVRRKGTYRQVIRRPAFRIWQKISRRLGCLWELCCGEGGQCRGF